MQEAGNRRVRWIYCGDMPYCREQVTEWLKGLRKPDQSISRLIIKKQEGRIEEESLYE